MLPQLQKLFDAQERERERVHARARALSPSQLVWMAKPGEWSALQIVVHLMRSDETIGAPGAALPGRASGALMQRFIVTAFRFNARLPLPDAAIDPASAANGAIGLDEALERWQRAREQLRGFMENVTPATARERPFAHPVIGPISPRQVLELGRAHMAYHRRQIDVLVSALPP